MQHWRGIFGSHGATFANNYRNRLVEWFLDNPRPGYAIAPTQPACIGDLNDDGQVNGADLGLVFAAWGETGVPADLGGDGTVGGEDIGLLLAAWGSCPG